MRSKNTLPKATFESAWALIQENAESLKIMKKEAAKERKEFRESMKVNEKEQKEFRETMKALQKEVGGISNSNGAMAESYFVNRFTKSMQFAGQKYDEISPNLSRKIKSLNLQCEYDLVLYNCSSVVIIEIKYKADKDDIEELLEKAPIFKKLYPQYANFDMYLGLAALHFNKKVEKESIKQGVAVIKQIGDAMVINDSYLKVF